MSLHGFKVLQQERPTPTRANSRYQGNDNYGRPKSEYLDKLSAMTDAELSGECYSVIYQAARCANNRKADWPWMADACLDESRHRKGDNTPGIYEEAWKCCVKENT